MNPDDIDIKAPGHGELLDLCELDPGARVVLPPLRPLPQAPPKTVEIEIARGDGFTVEEITTACRAHGAAGREVSFGAVRDVERDYTTVVVWTRPNPAYETWVADNAVLIQAHDARAATDAAWLAAYARFVDAIAAWHARAQEIA